MPCPLIFFTLSFLSFSRVPPSSAFLSVSVQRQQSLTNTRSLPTSAPIGLSATSNIPSDLERRLAEDPEVQRVTMWPKLPLSRSHERVLYVVYVGVGLGVFQRYPAAVAESAIVLMWVSFSLAISFMEAWVKFKAPFLRKHIAVDVGRHVFAALHAVELGLATALFLRTKQRPANSIVMATVLLAAMATIIEPILNVRTKHTIVNHEPKHQLNEKEAIAMTQLAQDIKGKPIPNAKWHLVYVLCEAVKIGLLVSFLW